MTEIRSELSKWQAETERGLGPSPRSSVDEIYHQHMPPRPCSSARTSLEANLPLGTKRERERDRSWRELCMCLLCRRASRGETGCEGPGETGKGLFGGEVTCKNSASITWLGYLRQAGTLIFLPPPFPFCAKYATAYFLEGQPPSLPSPPPRPNCYAPSGNHVVEAEPRCPPPPAPALPAASPAEKKNNPTTNKRCRSWRDKR